MHRPPLKFEYVPQLQKRFREIIDILVDEESVALGVWCPPEYIPCHVMDTQPGIRFVIARVIPLKGKRTLRAKAAVISDTILDKQLEKMKTEAQAKAMIEVATPLLRSITNLQEWGLTVCTPSWAYWQYDGALLV